MFKRIAEYFKQRAERAARDAEQRKFKRIGQAKVPVEWESIFGGSGHTVVYIYFYENGLGQRKIDITDYDHEIRKLPFVRDFLDGEPVSRVLKTVDEMRTRGY